MLYVALDRQKNPMNSLVIGERSPARDRGSFFYFAHFRTSQVSLFGRCCNQRIQQVRDWRLDCTPALTPPRVRLDVNFAVCPPVRLGRRRRITASSDTIARRYKSRLREIYTRRLASTSRRRAESEIFDPPKDGSSLKWSAEGFKSKTCTVCVQSSAGGPSIRNDWRNFRNFT